jgi:MFS family permease
MYVVLGFRTAMLIGAIIAVLAAGLLLTAGSLLHLTAACFVMGVGLGLCATPSIVAAQRSVDWHMRGVVTGANMFARSIGSAIGVAVFGGVANSVVGHSHADLEKLPGDVLGRAVHAVFSVAAIAAVLLIAAVVSMPNRIAERGN